MKNWIFIFGLCFLLASCKSVISYKTFDYKMVDRAKRGKFLKSEQHSSSNKYAIILADNLNPLDWETSPIIRALHKKRHQIIIPKLYGENESEVLQYNSKDQRLLSTQLTIWSLYNENILDSSSQVVLIGFGEGGYIVPDIAINNNISQFFIINAAVHSFKRELELNIEEGSLGFVQEPLIQRFGIRDYNQMLIALKELNKADDYSRSLGNKTNKDWNSYYKKPSLSSLTQMECPGYFIVSKDYPYISTTSKISFPYLFEAIAKTELFQQVEIDGKGEFKTLEEQEVLAKKLAKLIL